MKYRFFLMFLEKIIRIFSGLFIGSALAKYLTPTIFGDLALIQAIVAIVAVISSLGLETIVVKKMVQSSVSNVFKSLVVIKSFSTIFSVVIASIIMFLGYQFTGEMGFSAFIYLFFIVFSVFDVFDFSFQSINMPHYKSLFMLVGLTISAIAKVLCVYYELSLVYVAFCFVLEPLVVLALFFMVFIREFNFLEPVKPRLIVSLLKESAPLLLAGILYTAYAKVDQLMIQYYLNSYELGLYSAALRVTEPLVFFPVIVLTLIYPAMIKLKGNDDYNFLQLLDGLSQAFYLISLLMVVSFLLYGEQLFIMLFGLNYLDSVPVVLVQLCTLVFVYQITWMSRVMVVNGLQKYEIPRTFIGMIVNIVLNYLLIGRFGIIGAAISTLITMIFSCVIWQLFFKEVRFTSYIALKSFFFFNIKKLYKLNKGNIF